MVTSRVESGGGSMAMVMVMGNGNGDSVVTVCDGVGVVNDGRKGEGGRSRFLLPISSRQIDESISIADFFPPNY